MGKRAGLGAPRCQMNPFQLPERLTRLQIEVTTGCNLKCPGCQRTIGLEEGT